MGLDILVDKETKIKVPIGNHIGKKIVIGSDHRGYELKSELISYLKSKKYKVLDVGTNNDERTNYPEYSYLIGEQVSKDKRLKTVGIGVCGSGIGIGIPASKFFGVYPARCLDIGDAEMSRKHNNSNYLSISGDKTGVEDAKRIVDTWLSTDFYSNESEKAYLDRFVQTCMLERKSKK